MSQSEAVQWSPARNPERWLPITAIVLTGAACVLLAVERIWLAATQPLWFDEAWTLMAARTPNWSALVHEALTDVNAPLYYALLHAWAAVAGTSDLALRLPALLAVVAAGAIPLMRRIPGLPLEVRLSWGAIIFAWWGVDAFLAPGRCYGLLLALSTLQCALFADLLRKSTTRTALAWCAVGSAAILTHYYALVVTAAQGVIYLAACRERALRTWPAALAFAPAFGWLAWHAPRLRAFARPEFAWHARLGVPDMLAMTGFAFDPPYPLAGLAVALLAVAMLIWRPDTRTVHDDGTSAHLRLAAGASLAGLLLTLISGVLHPSLTARYLTPTAPGLLLGLVLGARRMPRPRLALAVLTAFYLATALRPAALAGALASRSPYGFETASQTLIRHGVSDVVFAWDHEVTALMPPDTLERLGSVFFRRAGSDIRVTPLVTHPADDVNLTALAAAHGPRPGIIWIYNRAGHTAAAVRPPRIPELDPRWRCERTGDAKIGSLACWRE